MEISGFDFKDQSPEKLLRTKVSPKVFSPKSLEIIVEDNKERSINTTLVEQQSQEPTSNTSNVVIVQIESGSQNHHNIVI